MTSGYEMCEIWHIVVSTAFWYTVYTDWIDPLQVENDGDSDKRTYGAKEPLFKSAALSKAWLDVVATS